ncbi:MAG TPA: radical SAM protein [bacterium (Candidatus Stahlbacteria)]|nr:radical SAM protein [Candidatus Stahlbacteria bacterium]
MSYQDHRRRGIYARLIDSLLLIAKIKILREGTLKILTPIVRQSISLAQYNGNNGRVLKDQTDMMIALLHSVMRSGVQKKTIKILMKKIFLNIERKEVEHRFYIKHRFPPPAFITISPGKECNLRCRYCYANASNDKEKLSYLLFSRIIKEAKRYWGTRFFVISGGEPFLWRDQGKDLLDIARENLDTIFMVYTNGTLIKGGLLNRLHHLGNILPAISVEGSKAVTDQRRGEGVYDQIVETMRGLKARHIAFGISMTATRENCQDLLSDKEIDFYFNELGAGFGWIFHYMPIGRDPDLDLMPTPEQREWMWQRSWEIIREKKILLADFWNHGTVSNGCISAGRAGGYFYIDWNGNITPCVFFPYSTMNINDLYKDGKTINAIFEDKFFSAIRCWQEGYGYRRRSISGRTDWLRPCPIRDHHHLARRIIRSHSARLIEGNDRFIETEEYIRRMEEYDRILKDRVGNIWKRYYVNG